MVLRGAAGGISSIRPDESGATSSNLKIKKCKGACRSCPLLDLISIFTVEAQSRGPPKCRRVCDGGKSKFKTLRHIYAVIRMSSRFKQSLLDYIHNTLLKSEERISKGASLEEVWRIATWPPSLTGPGPKENRAPLPFITSLQPARVTFVSASSQF
jgi:hypothetical protein